jgi:hypothetical protein
MERNDLQKELINDIGLHQITKELLKNPFLVVERVQIFNDFNNIVKKI